MFPLLNLESISKRFGYRFILKNISFSIESSEYVLLIGNNGAGKSTLLRIISALMNPTFGTISFRGANQKENLQEWLRIMGSMTHENRLYGNLSSIENLRLFGTLYGIEELKNKIEQILEKIELTHVAKLPVFNFSSGMTKRLMIGRMMLCQPKIIILDEPYTELDLHTLRWFQNYLHDFNQKGGTVLMVTHQLELGLEHASRVLVLAQQRIKHDISAEELNVDQCNTLLEK